MKKFYIIFLLLSFLAHQITSLPSLKDILTKATAPATSQPTPTPSPQPPSQPPSLKLVLLDSGINKLKNQVLNNLKNEFSGITLSETYSGLLYGVKNIVISSLNLDVEKAIISFPSQNSFAFNASDLNLTITCKYEYLGSSWYSAELVLDDIAVNLTGTVGLDQNNKMILNITYFKLTVGEMSILGVSSMLEKIISFFIGDLKTAVQNNANTVLMSQLQSKLKIVLNYELNYYPIPNIPCVLNIEASGSPKFTPNYLDFNFDAFIATQSSPLVRPQISETPDPFQNSSTLNDDFTLLVSQYLLNTFGSSLYLAKTLQINITDAQIPSISPFRLNTTGVEILFNNITNFYGENQPMNILCQLGQAPTFDLQNGNLTINVSITCDVFVKTQKAVTLESDSYFILNPSVVNNSVQANIVDCKIYNVTATNTQLSLDIKNIKGLFNLALVSAVPYLEEKIFQKGFVIPQIQNYTVSAYRIRIENETLILAADL